VSIPGCLIGSLIRIGNFFNQEILGLCTKVSWGVLFGHPVDGSLPCPRHPVQLYESVFYLVSFFVLWKAWYLYRSRQGTIFALCLMGVFSFRFLIEFFKEEQSVQIVSSFLTMGQWLSLPVILLGVFLFFYRRKHR
jgi:prolipoprotein diacylglyceryltransferase